jgi:hypothetical protein
VFSDTEYFNFMCMGGGGGRGDSPLTFVQAFLYIHIYIYILYIYIKLARQVRVGFVVDKVTIGEVSAFVLLCFLSVFFHQLTYSIITFIFSSFIRRINKQRSETFLINDAI